MKDKLIGSVIGLIRATEGNEDLINDNTNNLIVEGLYHSLNSNNEMITITINNIEQERKRLIPNCYNCLASCGRNDNYDLNNLNLESLEIQEIKKSIINKTQVLATTMFLNNNKNIEIIKSIYKALFLIGLDYLSKEDLFPILTNLNTI